MAWKKLLESEDLIAYEKSSKATKVRIEARLKDRRWRVYKTHNFLDHGEWTSHVKEYIAASIAEAKDLLSELKNEKDVSMHDVGFLTLPKLEMKRCFKEDFVEKWKFCIDDFNFDNFVVVRYEDEVRMDIVLHDRYNAFERQILERIISSLGLKEMSNKIRYDFFYFKKHSAKRRIYPKADDDELVAKFEVNIGPSNDSS